MRISFTLAMSYSPKGVNYRQNNLSNNQIKNNNTNLNNLSFGTTSRAGFLSNTVDYMYATDTNMFRKDLDWIKFANFLNKNFENKDKVNVICQACSDGSEAYTMAIALIETLGEHGAQKFFPIKAKDIDVHNIQNAKTGLINLTGDDIEKFKKLNINFNKYFTTTDEKLKFRDDRHEGEVKTYKVNPILKECVTFDRDFLENDANSMDDESNTVFLCRNVLPYLGRYDAPKVIKTLGENLKIGSVLALGDYYNQNFMFASKEKIFIAHCGFDLINKDMPYTYIKTREALDSKSLRREICDLSSARW